MRAARDGLAEEGDVVQFVDTTGAEQLGVVVGAMCVFRFVVRGVPSASGTIEPVDEQPEQLDSSLLRVVKRAAENKASDVAQPLRGIVALVLSFFLCSSVGAEELDLALSGGVRAFRTFSVEEAERKRDLFTEDAYQGMLSLATYVEYVETLKTAEDEPGCEACAANRFVLERAFQTVANEAFLEPGGGFTEARWAPNLYEALHSAGGLLHNDAETTAALSSLLSSLREPYSSYLDAPSWRAALNKRTPAELAYASRLATGVGVKLGERSAKGWLVAAPLAGGPAEEAGIRAGDELLSVDGVPTSAAGESVASIECRLRGLDGSDVELAVLQKSGGQRVERAFTLTRRSLPLPPLSSVRLLPLSSGREALFVRLLFFRSDGTEALRQALLLGESRGVDAVILDLRDNPGGTLEEAISSAAFFLPEGATVAATIRGGQTADAKYIAGRLPFPKDFPRLTTAPVVAIINGSTASAAEVFTAALHDNHAATILGEKSYGKSRVQFFFPLGIQGGLRLTVKKWLTPKGVDVELTRGITPDRICTDHPRAGGAIDECLLSAIRQI